MREVIENNQEWPCLARGGICVKSSDCPADKRSPVKGLCPLNQRSGYECCHDLPISETRCRARGGECVLRRCPENLTFHRATDCQQNEKCCILVRK
ncbi:hypothetical protein NE865_08772 [Phthorimaea operculella]|nr:hypothetical protein NE865_08772 [Phthorimaea operculella]